MLDVLLALLLLTTATNSLAATVRYVWQSSPSPTPPYTNWFTAATNIQDAVDAALAGDEIVVTNGIYATGGRVVGTNLLVNRVAVDKPLRMRSVNGPQFTVIQGYQVPGTTNGGGAIRCVYLADGASLSGFTLTNGATRAVNDSFTYRESSGGGVWCESTNAMVSNCVVAGNSVFKHGGGARSGTLNNCTLIANLAYGDGGGAFLGALNNCTLTGNSAERGGGASGSKLNNCTVTGNSAHLTSGGVFVGDLNNCIVYFNTAPTEANYDVGGAYYSVFMDYCCTTPLPEPWQGVGNITNDPLFVDYAGGNLRLQSNSPCINAGNNDYVTSSTDLDGNPRIVGGAVDIGAYEHQTPAFNVHYVWPDSPSPAAPFESWASAAHTIQEAVDGSQAGDHIVVTNGLYATGGRPVGTNLLVNRVAVDKPLTVRSVNGPTNTIIQGYQVPGTTNGDGAIRCVYLAGGASLSGFTLTNGATRTNGDYYIEQCGGGLWCESADAVASNCVAIGNAARTGGGAYSGTLNHCTLTGNSAHYDGGGGTSDSILNNCLLSGNSTANQGGGSVGGTLNNCTLTGNSAGWSGGGASHGTLNNCTLTGNSAGGAGGGAAGGYTTLNNCTLTGNSAGNEGGGVVGGTLNNCTLTGNSANDFGGGVSGAILNNCIVYFNTAPTGANYFDGPLWYGTEMNYCCTTPLPARGVGNISLDPQLLDAAHLSPASPCRGAGSAAYTTGTDIDGEAWGVPPSIGCDEYHTGPATGPLSVTVMATFTNVVAGYSVGLTALIEGRAATSVWDFGDGLAVTNQPYTAHAWTNAGSFDAVCRAYNASHPEGVSATVTVHVTAQALHYVAADATNPLPPYTSWATAASNIQDAVDVAGAGGTVLVTNGTYSTGGRAMVGTMTNRVAVDKPLTVRSVNGPQVTVIRGYQVPGITNGNGAIRCVYLANGASLSGFTLTNGATRSDGDSDERYGGGLWCESTSEAVSNCVVVGNSAGSAGGAYRGTLNNCTLTGNSASYGGDGGGADGSTLNNCTLTGNSASWGGGAYLSDLNNCMLIGNSAVSGGGVENSTLNNCTLTGNSAKGGGGASWSTLNNCIILFNTAPVAANYYEDPVWAVLNYCCTTPVPTNGVGNITNAPLFVDLANGDLRLQSNSPCINAGRNAYAPGPTDLDGLPRIVRGTVDIGAYEFQGPGSVISYAWLQRYSLPTDGSVDATDPDADGHTTWQEWRCQTDPTNALSVLRLLSASRAGTNVSVTWQSVAGMNYFLERSTDLAATPPFTLLAPNIPGRPGATSISDTNAAKLSPLFYRVGVGN